MRPKIVVGTVALSRVSLLVVGIGVYFFSYFASYLRPESKIEAQCQNKNLEISMKGCTAVIDGGNAETHALTYAYNRRSPFFVSMNQLDKAFDDANHAVQLEPQNAFGYFNRVTALLRKGNLAGRGISPRRWRITTRQFN
jgi:hypothetical protein